MSTDHATPSSGDHHLHLPPQVLKEESIGEKMQTIKDALPPDGVSLEDIRDLVGQEGLLILTAFLTIVFLVPVSIPGVSTVFGAAILLIGLCRLCGIKLWLPKQIAQRVLPTVKLRSALDQGSIWVHRLEKVSRPHRLSGLASGRLIEVFNNLALVMAAILLMAPFGLIPFSNTLPAVALLFFAIGFLERDGLFIVLGHATNLLTVLYFSLLIVGGGAVITALWSHLFCVKP
jgi:hypothetical protein